MSDIESDIGTALMRLRTAFAKQGIPCPDVLEYSDSKKAYEAIGPLRHGIGPMNWSMDKNAKPYGEMCLAGFTVRFEARSIERPMFGPELDDGVSAYRFKDGQS